MKQHLINGLQRFAPNFSIKRLSRWTGQRLVFPFYHTIAGSETLPHIHHLYSPRTKAQFIADLDFFLQHYQVIDLSDLLAQIKQGRPMANNAFLLSFDDGLK
ncbi:MAG: polysaccharide deacetylase, partial [Bacteroidota bacterium]